MKFAEMTVKGLGFLLLPLAAFALSAFLTSSMSSGPSSIELSAAAGGDPTLAREAEATIAAELAEEFVEEDDEPQELALLVEPEEAPATPEESVVSEDVERPAIDEGSACNRAVEWLDLADTGDIAFGLHTHPNSFVGVEEGVGEPWTDVPAALDMLIERFGQESGPTVRQCEFFRTPDVVGEDSGAALVKFDDWYELLPMRLSDGDWKVDPNGQGITATLANPTNPSVAGDYLVDVAVSVPGAMTLMT